MNRHVNKSRWYAWALLLAPAALAPACGGDDDNGGSTPLDGGMLDGGGMDGSVGPDGGGIVSDGGGGTDGQVPADGGGGAVNGDLWAYTSTNKLLKLESASGRIEKSVDATPPTGETVWGVDVRPSDGKIYALTSAGSVYSVNATTGAFADKHALIADEADATEPFTALAGTAFAVDFNPVVDRLRVISNTGQNLRVDVATGKVTTDTATPGGVGLAAGAYTNSWPQGQTPCGTTLYAIDASGSELVVVAPPNNGVLSSVGALSGGVSKQIHGFDIVTGSKGENVAFLAATETAGEVIYRLDLASAKATALGTVSGQGTLVAVFGNTPSARPSGKLGELVATTEGGKVVTFERGSPSTLCTDVALNASGDNGLEAGEEVVGGDVRPSDKAFYVVTRTSPANTAKLRRLDIATGVFGATVPLSAADGDDNPYEALTGNDFGVSFNPVVDRLRVTSDTGLNLRVDPGTGKVTTDTAFNTAANQISEVAYTNPTGSVPATSTTLFGINSNGDHIVLIGGNPAGDGDASPNSGKTTDLATIDFGAGLAALNTNGAAIEPGGGTALAALSVGANGGDAAMNVSLFRLDAAAANDDPVATSFGKIGAGTDIVNSLSFTPKP